MHGAETHPISIDRDKPVELRLRTPCCCLHDAYPLMLLHCRFSFLVCTVARHTLKGKLVHPANGRVLEREFIVLDRQPEFIAIDEQSDADVVHLDRCGTTNRLARQALASRA